MRNCGGAMRIVSKERAGGTAPASSPAPHKGEREGGWKEARGCCWWRRQRWQQLWSRKGAAQWSSNTCQKQANGLAMSEAQLWWGWWKGEHQHHSRVFSTLPSEVSDLPTFPEGVWDQPKWSETTATWRFPHAFRGASTPYSNQYLNVHVLWKRGTPLDQIHS